MIDRVVRTRGVNEGRGGFFSASNRLALEYVCVSFAGGNSRRRQATTNATGNHRCLSVLVACENAVHVPRESLLINVHFTKQERADPSIGTRVGLSYTSLFDRSLARLHAFGRGQPELRWCNFMYLFIYCKLHRYIHEGTELS